MRGKFLRRMANRNNFSWLTLIIKALIFHGLTLIIKALKSRQMTAVAPPTASNKMASTKIYIICLRLHIFFTESVLAFLLLLFFQVKCNFCSSLDCFTSSSM